MKIQDSNIKYRNINQINQILCRHCKINKNQVCLPVTRCLNKISKSYLHSKTKINNNMRISNLFKLPK